jgi:hypothetical protein
MIDRHGILGLKKGTKIARPGSLNQRHDEDGKRRCEQYDDNAAL